MLIVHETKTNKKTNKKMNKKMNKKTNKKKRQKKNTFLTPQQVLWKEELG